MTPEATSYLIEALDYIKQHSVMSANIVLSALRHDVLALVAKAQTTADAYPAIRLVLERLGDRHSFLLDPEVVKQHREGSMTGFGLMVAYPDGVIVQVFPGSPADRAGVRMG